MKEIFLYYKYYDSYVIHWDVLFLLKVDLNGLPVNLSLEGSLDPIIDFLEVNGSMTLYDLGFISGLKIKDFELFEFEEIYLKSILSNLEIDRHKAASLCKITKFSLNKLINLFSLEGRNK